MLLRDPVVSKFLCPVAHLSTRDHSKRVEVATIIVNRAFHVSVRIQCTILGDVFCSVYDVNVHVNNDVLVQAYCGVFISRMCLYAREEGTH